MQKKLDVVSVIFTGWICFCFIMPFFYAHSEYALSGKFWPDYFGSFFMLVLSGWIAVTLLSGFEKKRRLAESGVYDKREFLRRLNEATKTIEIES